MQLSYVNTLLDMVDDGTIDRNELIMKLLKFIGEDEAKLFMYMNNYEETQTEEHA